MYTAEYNYRPWMENVKRNTHMKLEREVLDKVYKFMKFLETRHNPLSYLKSEPIPRFTNLQDMFRFQPKEEPQSIISMPGGPYVKFLCYLVNFLRMFIQGMQLMSSLQTLKKIVCLNSAKGY